MESRIKVFGHPAHQLLVPLPIGAFSLSMVMDAFYTITRNRKHLETSRQALDFGLCTAALAAPLGAVDLWAVPSGTRAKRIGMAHALGNVVMLGLFATSRLMRRDGHVSPGARWVSGSAFVLSGLTAWLGGELVVRHGVGISDRALSDQNSARLNERAQPQPVRVSGSVADLTPITE
jgi:uncharacterized membrane protein